MEAELFRELEKSLNYNFWLCVIISPATLTGTTLFMIVSNQQIMWWQNNAYNHADSDQEVVGAEHLGIWKLLSDILGFLHRKHLFLSAIICLFNERD